MNNKKRDVSLDLIKIIATIFIILHHYQQITGVFFEGSVNFFNGRFYFGYLVEMFFIISGMLMYSYIEKIKQGMSFQKFYLKRYLRLLPLMFLSIIVCDILLIVYKRVFSEAWFNITPTLKGTIISILGVQCGWIFKNPMINNPIWYISVLLLCYIIFYFLVKIAEFTKIKCEYLFAIMIAVGIATFQSKINIPFLNPYSSRGYYAFFFGIILMSIINVYDKTDKVKINNILSVVCIIVSATCIYLIVANNNFIRKNIVYVVTYVLYPAIIIALRSNLIKKYLNKTLISNIVNKLSAISFDSFIWHCPVIIFFQIVFEKYGINISYNNYVVMIMYVITCYVIGTISYYLIEQKIGR